MLVPLNWRYGLLTHGDAIAPVVLVEEALGIADGGQRGVGRDQVRLRVAVDFTSESDPVARLSVDCFARLCVGNAESDT
jgi:hypothetical protein